MTDYRFTVEAAVDEELLDAHDGVAASPGNDPKDWSLRDLFDAYSRGIVDPEQSELSNVTRPRKGK